MKTVAFKYFKIILIILLVLHLIGVARRGFQYPFDSIGDFLFKFFVTLGMSLPIYLILSTIGGFVIGLILNEMRKKRDLKKN
jgi:hypothetical protein